MPSNVHSQLTDDEIHIPFRKIFNNNSELIIDSTSYESADLYKMGYVKSSGKLYVLTSISPIQWNEVSGGGGGGGGSSVVYSQVSTATTPVVSETIGGVSGESVASGDSVLTIPMNTLIVGDKIIYRFIGQYANSTDPKDFEVKYYIGSQAIPVGASFTPINNRLCFVEIQISTISIGSTFKFSVFSLRDIQYSESGITNLVASGFSGVSIPINLSSTNLNFKVAVNLTGGTPPTPDFSDNKFDILFSDISVVRG